MRNSILTIKNVYLSFQSIDEIKIFEDLNFEVKEGDLVGIKAPSGSGKTSLFRLIMNYIKPNSGSIELTKDPTLISQKPYLNPYLTVNELLEIELLQNPKKMDLEDIFKNTGLFECKDHLFSNLSGGQKQRVVLLSKLISNKKFILADEPFSALEKKTSEETIILFFSQLKEWKITSILTSHNPEHLKNVDKIFTIENCSLKELI
jgi:putative hydroxymethylpyrimidine transport system ATP-binding protein